MCAYLLVQNIQNSGRSKPRKYVQIPKDNATTGENRLWESLQWRVARPLRSKYLSITFTMQLVAALSETVLCKIWIMQPESEHLVTLDDFGLTAPVRLKP